MPICALQIQEGGMKWGGGGTLEEGRGWEA